VTAPVGRLASISLDCPDPNALALFYADLLGMRRTFESPDGRIIGVSDGTHWLTMMRVDDYVSPSWPHPGQLQQMHLDVSVTDLEAATTRAVDLGARLAGHQVAPDAWRVLLDPAGHPFCLTTVTAD
jgi:catechol 2,3-dioxygenase-like lactoylglutathione lyase family enzyme